MTAPGECPFEVTWPVMRQRWERLTFLHWAYEPGVVQRLLPASLRVQAYDGAAWVGLIPFFMGVSLPGAGELPWLSHFCETNVRTYVVDRRDRPGIWFFSLEASRLAAVAAARSGYGLPYYWAAMRLAQRGDRIGYAARRRWPGPVGASSRIVVRAGAPISPAEVSMRDHFLTARWRLFAGHGARARLTRASHQPWPLYQAQLLDLDDSLVPAAGLPPPQGEPLVLYSPGVDVRIGRPELA